MSRSRAWGFTPAAERTVELCRRLSRDAGVSEDWSAVLLFSLLRDESLASACLRDCGIGAGDLGAVLPAGVSVEGVWGFAEQIESEGSGCGVARGLTDPADPECFRRLLERAREVARRETRDGAITIAVLDAPPVLRSLAIIRQGFVSTMTVVIKIAKTFTIVQLRKAV